ncbi:MAG TPA: hypothetical protein VFV57_01670 [Limnobacter sp.]|nr:hypothetical protein [Limnobacter sp.]
MQGMPKMWVVWLLSKVTVERIAVFAIATPTVILLFGESILSKQQAYAICIELAPHITAWAHWNKWGQLHSEIVLLYLISVPMGLGVLLFNILAFQTHKPLYWGRSVPRWVLYGLLEKQFQNRRQTIVKLNLSVLVISLLITLNLDFFYLDPAFALDTSGTPRGRKEIRLHASAFDFWWGGMVFYCGLAISAIYTSFSTSLLIDLLILIAHRIHIRWLRCFNQNQKADQLEEKLNARDQELLEAQMAFKKKHGFK